MQEHRYIYYGNLKEEWDEEARDYETEQRRFWKAERKANRHFLLGCGALGIVLGVAFIALIWLGVS